MTAPVDNYYEQGLVMMDEGDHAQAIALFTKALRLSLGDLAEIHLCRGEAYAYMQEPEHALADFNAALELNPYMADAYNERGNLWRFHSEYEAAIADYSAAIQCDPAHIEAYYNRALAHEELRQYREAIADFSRAVHLNPGLAPAYEARGRVCANIGDFEGAIDDLTRYLRMGGGREYDNQSEIQSLLIVLRFKRFMTRLMGFGRKPREALVADEAIGE